MVSLAVAHSRALRGLSAPAVRVEVHLGTGLPAFAIVGLPEAAVRESRERVRAALIESGFDFPNRRITVNLAPADLPKDSARFDLPIAVGILAASQALPGAALEAVELVGELSLGGALRPIRGALALAAGFAAEAGDRSLVLPRENAPEAALSGHPAILGAGSLREVCEHLGSRKALAREPIGLATCIEMNAGAAVAAEQEPDLADVIGQVQARRALEIAAAGRHHLLMTGPPGTGKSLLARRLPGLLPPPSRREALAAAAIASLRDPVDPARWMRRPFRSPHHSVSVAGLIGGGQPPRPGEISLAHEGVLFLDELPEFRRAALEAMREPLETCQVTVARGVRSETFPAGFLLVGAMNPCPCGYLGDAMRTCRCTPEHLRRYRARLSGPLLDRFDLSVDVRREGAILAAGSANEASAPVARRVAAARDRQRMRQGRCNGDLLAGDLQRHLGLATPASDLAARAASRFGWSMRALHRALKVARTIADLAGRDEAVADDVAEAIALRRGLECWTAAVTGADPCADSWAGRAA